MFRKSSFLTSLLLSGCLAVSGCTSLFIDRTKNNLLFTDKDIDDIFKAYQRDAEKAKAGRTEKLRKSIKRLDVVREEGKGKKKEFLVSIDLENAPLSEVMEVLLTKTETPFFLQDVKLTGFVSGRFEKIPFIRAVNIILNAEGYSATMSKDGILFIQASYGIQSADKPAAPGPADEEKAESTPEPSGQEPAPQPQAPAAPPAPDGPQPSSFRDSYPPAMFRRTTLLAQNIPPAPGVPGIPQAPPVPAPPGAPAAPPDPGLPGAPPAAPARKPLPEISIEYPLQHLNAESADKVLARLFPGDAGAPGGGLPGAPPGPGGGEISSTPLRYGVEPTRNTVMIRGPQDQVLKLKKVLQTIDREPQHVLIEVLFLEVSADALETLNFAIRDYAQKRYSALATQIGREDALALQFTFENLVKGQTGFTTNLKFTGVMDLLFRKNLGRVIARPYLASLTGKTSVLKITEDRSIIVQQVQGGAAVTSTKEISSGVELKITPTVHLSGSIRMEIEVEESEFLPAAGNVASSKNTNRAQNIMQVASGESIIIGGLMLNKRQWSKGGLPWLREVPILNIFTAAQRRTEVDKEVLVVVTPHLYSPGLRTPLPFLEIFQKDPIIKYTTPGERFEFDK